MSVAVVASGVAVRFRRALVVAVTLTGPMVVLVVPFFVMFLQSSGREVRNGLEHRQRGSFVRSGNSKTTIRREMIPAAALPD